MKKIKHFCDYLLLIGFVLLSCAPQSAYFSSIAYEQATSLKVDSLSLMVKAAEPYANNEEEVMVLLNRIEKAYEYAKGRPNNEFTTKQWEILKDLDGNLMGNFMNRWQEQEKLNPTFINEFKLIVSDTFDTIIGLESQKIKPPKE
jgi:CRISPR/Cas system-associated protein Csx1